MEKEIKNGWHLRREISLTHIITTLLVIMSVLKFGYDMDKRIIILETKYHFSSQAISSINSKLDRIIEQR